MGNEEVLPYAVLLRERKVLQLDKSMRVSKLLCRKKTVLSQLD